MMDGTSTVKVAGAIDLTDFPTDTLLTMMEDWHSQGNRLLYLAARAEKEVLRRMRKDGASAHLTADSTEWRRELGIKAHAYNIDLQPLLHSLILLGEEITHIIAMATSVEEEAERLGKLKRSPERYDNEPI